MQEHYLVPTSPPITQSTSPSAYGDLGLLPPEIRTMIYAPVFASGSTALTRTSKALHKETWDALHRCGVYRVHINSDFEDWQGSDMVGKYLKNVQNVYLRITSSSNFPPRWYNMDSDAKPDQLLALHRLVEAIEKPRTCRVQILMAITIPFLWKTVSAITWLRDFERVDVEFLDHIMRPSLPDLYFVDDRVVEMSVKFVRWVADTNEESGEKRKVRMVYMDRDIDLHSLGEGSIDD